MGSACVVCGAALAGRQLRFCAPPCKQVDARRRRAAGRSAEQRRRGDPLPPPAGVVVAVRAELTRAGQVGSAAGELALVLAARMDDQSTPTSALAGLSRELRELLSAAGARPGAADPVDDLRARRDRKRAAQRLN